MEKPLFDCFKRMLSRARVCKFSDVQTRIDFTSAPRLGVSEGGGVYLGRGIESHSCVYANRRADPIHIILFLRKFLM